MIKLGKEKKQKLQIQIESTAELVISCKMLQIWKFDNKSKTEEEVSILDKINRQTKYYPGIVP